MSDGIETKPTISEAPAELTPDAPRLGELPPDEAPRPILRQSRAQWFAGTILPPLVLGCVIIGVWYFFSYVVLDADRRFLLRPFHQVVDVAILDSDNLIEILDGLRSSAKVAMIGLWFAICIGFALSTVMSQQKIAERAIFPYMVTLQSIPILAIIPLISFWFGNGRASRLVVCTLISLFPIIVNTLFGLHSAEPGQHDLFTLHHANRGTRLRKLMFPAAGPAIFAGLRISAGLSVIGAIVGDFFFGRGDVGIGQLLRRYANQLEGEELLTAVLFSSAFGVAVFLIFGWIQSRMIGAWYDTRGGSS